jgi:SAM-dependent methyltransferase
MHENRNDWLFTHPRMYDTLFDNFSADIPLYEALAKKYGDPILELMCGTGRVTIPLAKKGFNITGLDISSEMLGVARQKAKDAGLEINWIEADGRDFSLKEKYSCVFIPFNSFLNLSGQADMEACLKSVRAHMKHDGCFAIDIFNPDLKILMRRREDRFPVETIQNPDGEGQVVITESTFYDAVEQIINIRWFYKFEDTGNEFAKDFSLRILFPREVDNLLRYSGFVVDDKFGDYDFSPFTASSAKQLIVCRPR